MGDSEESSETDGPEDPEELGELEGNLPRLFLEELGELEGILFWAPPALPGRAGRGPLLTLPALPVLPDLPARPSR